MNKEIQSIIRRIENVNSGEPWFGRAIYSILEETDPKKVLAKACGLGEWVATQAGGTPSHSLRKEILGETFESGRTDVKADQAISR